jgi:NAD-dependent aldehyde dehydrogenases
MKVPIGASWVDRDEKTPVINPATGEPVDYVPSLTVDDVRSAIDAAYEALDSVQSLTIAKRARLLLRAADMIRQRLEDLARTMALEIGRPVRSARLEVERAAQIFELAASEVRRALTGEFVPLEMYEWPAGNENRVAMVKREPVGVVASITPFNFPAASFAHKVAPALAVGNTVVHKPPQRPLDPDKDGRHIARSGVPAGERKRRDGRPVKIGDELVANDKIALITFTGSDRTGLGVIAPRAISRGKRLIMELGGSDAMVVLEDADLARAAKAAVYGRFDYSGQFCNATKRLIVRREVAERFAEFLVEEVRRLKVGDPLDEGTDIGPLISQDAVRSMRSFLEDAVARGGQILVQLKAPEKGFYFPPTVIRLDLRSGARSLREEVFGPIFPVVVVEDDEEAVEAANATDYGLDAAIFTRDFARAYRLASRIKAGTIMVNDTTRLRWDALPFGGFKRSAVGREGVYHTMLAMTELKVIAWRLD